MGKAKVKPVYFETDQEFILKNGENNLPLNRRKSSLTDRVISARDGALATYSSAANSSVGKFASGVLQLELAGVYSEERALALQRTLTDPLRKSLFLMCFFGLLVPLFASFFIVCVAVIPIQPPSPVIDDNEMFFVVAFIAITGFGYSAAGAVGSLLPDMKLSFVSNLIMCFSCSFTYTLSLYAMGHAFGFPIPFATTLPMGPAIGAIIAVIYWKGRGRFSELPDLRNRILGICKFALVACLPLAIFPGLTIVLLQINNPFVAGIIGLIFPAVKLVLRYYVYHIIDGSNGEHVDLSSKMAIFCH